MLKHFLSIFFFLALFFANAYADVDQSYTITTTKGDLISNVYITKITDKTFETVDKKDELISRNISLNEIDIISKDNDCLILGMVAGSMAGLITAPNNSNNNLGTQIKAVETGVQNGILIGFLSSAICFAMNSETVYFKDLAPTEKKEFLKKVSIYETTPPLKIIEEVIVTKPVVTKEIKEEPAFKKSQWNIIPAYSFGKTLVAGGFGNNEYTWQSSGTIGVGIEYENYINENLSYGIGFSLDSHQVENETVKTNGVQTAQTTFTGQKPELGNFNIWGNLYFYPIPKFYVLGGFSSGGDGLVW
jgi:predicted nuclease of predicted toxin-antitoxin system